MAFSCRLSMDLLCQEMRDASEESSESLGSPRSLCSECHRSSLVELSQQQSLFSHLGRAATVKERDVVREMQEKERERRALLSCVGWPVSFQFLMVKHGVPVERGSLLFLLV